MKKAILKSLPLESVFSHDEKGDIHCKITSVEPMVFEPITKEGKLYKGWKFPVGKDESESIVFVISLPKGYDVYKEQVVRVVDCTPNWRVLFPVMWKLLEQGKKSSFENLKPEFLKMAEAADKWNQHCKQNS